MCDHNEFFEQLRRGGCPSSDSLHQQLHRIPPEIGQAAVQVGRLLRHAEDQLGELSETIGNILRWHGHDEILSCLNPGQQLLWRRLKTIVPAPEFEE